MGALDPRILGFAPFVLVLAAFLLVAIWRRKPAPTQFDRRMADERERRRRNF